MRLPPRLISLMVPARDRSARTGQTYAYLCSDLEHVLRISGSAICICLAERQCQQDFSIAGRRSGSNPDHVDCCATDGSLGSTRDRILLRPNMDAARPPQALLRYRGCAGSDSPLAYPARTDIMVCGGGGVGG